jgi:Sec-independent protein translocase protein TatA
LWLLTHTNKRIYEHNSYNELKKEFFNMLEPWEWLIIGMVAVIVFLWIPTKFLDFPKGLGRDKAEFNQASKEFIETANAEPSVNTTTHFIVPTSKQVEDEVLIKTPKDSK